MWTVMNYIWHISDDFQPSGNDTIFDETIYYVISSGICCIASHIFYIIHYINFRILYFHP